MLLVAGEVTSARDFAAVTWLLKGFVWYDHWDGRAEGREGLYFLSLECQSLAMATKTLLYREHRWA